MPRLLDTAICAAALIGIAWFVASGSLSPSANIPPDSGSAEVTEAGPQLLDEHIIPGRFLPPVPRLVDGNPLAVHDSERTILIIYNNGTIFDEDPDACLGKYLPPRILRDLVGREISGYKLALFHFCSHQKVGAYRKGQRRRELRPLRRAKDVENLIQSFVDAGLPAEQIFLSGQSEGAWASLTAARRGEIAFGGMVIFAPSVGGPWAKRTDRLWRLHREQVSYIREAPRIEALVFGFEEDSYTPARDLRFLNTIAGVSFVSLSGHSIEGIPCREPEPHFIAYRDCFRRTQEPVIVTFLEQRLWQLGLAN